MFRQLSMTKFVTFDVTLISHSELDYFILAKDVVDTLFQVVCT